MLSLSQVAARLERVHPVLTAAHLGAAERLKAMDPDAAAALNAIERANFLHAQVRSLVAVGIEQMEGVHVTQWDVDTIAVGTDLLVKFNYVTDPPRHTKQQKMLKRQEYKPKAMEILSLSGITEPPTTVTCAYTLDGMDIGRVLIRRERTGHETWEYDIHGGLAVVEPQIIPGIKEARPAVVRSKKASEGVVEDEASGGDA